MAVGDAAIADGMAVLNGSEDADDIDLEITRTRDYIADRHGDVADGAVTAVKIAAGAVTNTKIGAAAVTVDKVDAYTDPSLGASKMPRYNSTGKLATNNPTSPLHAANKQYVDALRADMMEYIADINLRLIALES